MRNLSKRGGLRGQTGSDFLSGGPDEVGGRLESMVQDDGRPVFNAAFGVDDGRESGSAGSTRDQHQRERRRAGQRLNPQDGAPGRGRPEDSGDDDAGEEEDLDV